MGSIRRAFKSPVLRAVLSHRAFQFLFLGTLIFLYTQHSGEDQISFSQEELDALYLVHAQKEGRLVLDEAAKSEVAGRAVEDEILYREGLRMGFDKEDHIVKQRVIQKVLSAAVYMNSQAATPETKREYFQSHRDDFKVPATVDFEQVFFRADQEKTAKATQLRLNREVASVKLDKLGVAFPLDRKVTNLPLEKVTHDYGPEFAEKLSKLTLNSWSEPIASKFGLHLVRVTNRSESRQMNYEEAQGALELAVVSHLRDQAVEKLLDKAKSRYSVRLPNHLKTVTVKRGPEGLGGGESFD